MTKTWTTNVQSIFMKTNNHFRVNVTENLDQLQSDNSTKKKKSIIICECECDLPKFDRSNGFVKFKPKRKKTIFSSFVDRWKVLWLKIFRNERDEPTFILFNNTRLFYCRNIVEFELRSIVAKQHDRQMWTFDSDCNGFYLYTCFFSAMFAQMG